MNNHDQSQHADMQPGQNPDHLQQAIQDAHTEDPDASVQIPAKHQDNDPPHKEIGDIKSNP